MQAKHTKGREQADTYLSKHMCKLRADVQKQGHKQCTQTSMAGLDHIEQRYEITQMEG